LSTNLAGRVVTVKEKTMKNLLGTIIVLFLDELAATLGYIRQEFSK
jgi:hypothetical protein